MKMVKVTNMAVMISVAKTSTMKTMSMKRRTVKMPGTELRLKKVTMEAKSS